MMSLSRFLALSCLLFVMTSVSAQRLLVSTAEPAKEYAIKADAGLADLVALFGPYAATRNGDSGTPTYVWTFDGKEGLFAFVDKAKGLTVLRLTTPRLSYLGLAPGAPVEAATALYGQPEPDMEGGMYLTRFFPKADVRIDYDRKTKTVAAIFLYFRK